MISIVSKLNEPMHNSKETREGVRRTRGTKRRFVDLVGTIQVLKKEEEIILKLVSGGKLKAREEEPKDIIDVLGRGKWLRGERKRHVVGSEESVNSSHRRLLVCGVSDGDRAAVSGDSDR
uniref:Uncharacterized protein n=1 Tax=Opuntia streptacantha TaxID=393608 RepID=A0A7C9FHP6_OPUST